MKNAKYYVIETVYAGPNLDDHADDDTVIISTEPARTNMSHEVKIEGWCGTNGDWATYAHGEYDTLDEAREAIEKMFNGARETELEHTPDDCVEAYKPGQYEQMGGKASVDWLYVAMTEDVNIDTTDADISELLDGYEEDAKKENYVLDRGAVETAMTEIRTALIESVVNDNALENSCDLTSSAIQIIHDHGQVMKPTSAFGGCMTSMHELNGVEVMEFVDTDNEVDIYAVVPEGTAAAFEKAVLDTNNMEYRTADAHRFFVANKHRFDWVDSDGDLIDVQKLDVA